MECGLQCFLTLFILYLLHEGSFGQNTDCKVESFNRTFPGSLVPKSLRFMIYQTNFNEAFSGVISRNISCIDGSDNNLTVRPCNRLEKTQMWFQYQGSIINIGTGKSILRNGRNLVFAIIFDKGFSYFNRSTNFPYKTFQVAVVNNVLHAFCNLKQFF